MSNNPGDINLNNGEQAKQPFKFNFVQQQKQPESQETKQSTFTFGNAASTSSAGQNQITFKFATADSTQKPSIQFNFAKSEQKSEDKDNTKGFNGKVEHVNEKVLCETDGIKVYYLDKKDDKQEWTEFDCLLVVQLIEARGENSKDAQKVFIAKMKLAESAKADLGSQETASTEKVQKVIIKMSPSISKFKRVGKKGFQVSGPNFCIIDEKNNPTIKNYYVKADDDFIAKLKENGIEM